MAAFLQGYTRREALEQEQVHCYRIFIYVTRKALLLFLAISLPLRSPRLQSPSSRAAGKSRAA
ncbi:MAG: hypothetical protein ACFNXT_07660, partial [Actinomyces massiliensis]